MKKLTLVIVTALAIITIPAKAQLSKISFLNGGVSDFQTLTQAYLNPWAKSIGAGLDAGWYNSAKPHSLLGFDLTLSTSFAIVPSSEKTFDVASLKFQNFEVSGTSTTAQTVAGNKNAGPTINVYATDQNGTKRNIGSFEMPGGSGLPGLPVPMVKVGLGLPFSTELDARFLPTVSMGNAGKTNLWGLALKHSIKQWIPVINHVPFWDLSLFGAYSHFRAAKDIRFLPSDASSNITYTGSSSDFDGQKAQFDVNAWDISLLIGTNLPIFNVYGALGYMSSQANLAMKGSYYAGGDLNATNYNSTTNKVIVNKSDLKTDPVNMDFAKFSNVKVTLGMRLKLAVITINADYSYAGYSIYSAGLGLSFR
jgi:hypothetical protein